MYEITRKIKQTFKRYQNQGWHYSARGYAEYTKKTPNETLSVYFNTDNVVTALIDGTIVYNSPQFDGDGYKNYIRYGKVAFATLTGRRKINMKKARDSLNWEINDAKGWSKKGWWR